MKFGSVQQNKKFYYHNTMINDNTSWNVTYNIQRLTEIRGIKYSGNQTHASKNSFLIPGSALFSETKARITNIQ